MAQTPSTMLALGTAAPEFFLTDASGKAVKKTDFAGKPLLVAFICNHCPYVKHLRSSFSAFAKEYQARGLAVVAINPNDFVAYPDDSPTNMVKESQQFGYTFPYLVDETQGIAKAYQAACTPEFYLFDAKHTLVYRGQYDGSRPSNAVPITGSDLRRAADGLLQGAAIPQEQVPSIGCNIKWKKGNAPTYA